MVGPGIVIPIVLVAVVVPAVWFVVHRSLRAGGPMLRGDSEAAVSGRRITSQALRSLPSPPWRVVPEIPEHALGGIEHVLVGPGGIFAVVTSMTPLPCAGGDDATAARADAATTAMLSIARMPLDDVLAPIAMSSSAHLTVHWGTHGEPRWCTTAHGAVGVAGDCLEAWAASLPDALSAEEVVRVWRAVTTGIGRPDPAASSRR